MPQTFGTAKPAEPQGLPDQAGAGASFGQCIAGALATGAGYFFSAELGEALAFPSAPVSAFWAPNAILLAALALTPFRYWWVHLGAAFVAHFAAQLPIVSHIQAIIQYIANCGVAVIGAIALRELHARPLRFDRLRPAINLILFGGIIAPLCTSLLLAAAFVAVGLTLSFWLTAIVRTVTNMFAILTLVPLIVHFADAMASPRVRIPWRRMVEAILLTASLVTVGLLVFVLPEAGPHQSPSLLYVPFPVLLWAAVRFGTTGVCASMLVIGALSTWGVLHGNGPFVHQEPVDNALSVVFFLVVTSMPLMLLAGLLNERKMTTAALIESESRRRGEYELHRAVMASLEDQIAVIDKNGSIVEVNSAWRMHAVRGTSTAHNALPGTNYVEALHAAAGDSTLTIQIAEALKSVLSSECLRKKFEYAVRTADGLRWVEHSIECLMRPEGGAVLTVSDATDRKHAEREAQARLKQLAHLSRVAAVGEISGAIAHEVNQPLTAILGNAEAGMRLLRAQPPDIEHVREILHDIVRNDLRAAEVVKRVRCLLRNGEMRLQPLRLNDLVKDVLKLLHTDLVQRHILFELDLAADLGQVEGDSVQLEQVILNLLMNACEAMHDLPHSARRLHVVTRPGPNPGEVELAIRDFGYGIPMGECERIFHPFVTTKSEGLGLGLSIGRSIVKAHRGRLWAECASQGAIFRLVLRQCSEDRGDENGDSALTPAQPVVEPFRVHIRPDDELGVSRPETEKTIAHAPRGA